jgi:transposase
MDAVSIQQLQAENQALREEVARLQQTVRDLHKRLEQAERSAKRQAAPFSKNEPKKNGRKRGKKHGKHNHRQPPTPPTNIDEMLDAALPDHCPDCGGDVVEDHLDQQFQTEIPRKPIVRKINIHCGHCNKCGKKVRGRHPLQTSDATGAAQSQLGPDAQAAVVDLNKRAGMSYGKIACIAANLATQLKPEQVSAILELCADRQRLEATPLDTFMAMWVRE